ncbi:hypothetical protein Tco_0153074 [Tanacetum coccineum]
MVPYQSPPQNSQIVLANQLDNFKKTTEGSMQAMRNHITNLKAEIRSEAEALILCLNIQNVKKLADKQRRQGCGSEIQRQGQRKQVGLPGPYRGAGEEWFLELADQIISKPPWIAENGVSEGRKIQLIRPREGGFKTFSNPLFEKQDDFPSRNDESILKEETLKSYLNPLFEKDEEIISNEASSILSPKIDVKTIMSFFAPIGNCVRKWATSFPDFGSFMVQILWKDKAIPAISIDGLQSSLHKWENSTLLSLFFIELTSILLACLRIFVKDSF